MRISCSVDLINRISPSLSVKKQSKGGHAQLSIGKKPSHDGIKEGTMFLMMCTAKDKNGTKYLIKDNIMQIFGKFVQEGKATVRLKDPEVDLLISKADSLQLKNFLSVLKTAAQGKVLDNVTLSTLAPANSKSVEKPKSKMTIKDRKDYPLRENFPQSLEKLQVSCCRLKRIDTRIFSLRKLEVLNLSENVLESLPEDISKLGNLRELIVSNNLLSAFPASLCLKENFRQNLSLLDLCHNCLETLPLQICELESLVSLKVDHNKLQTLPPTIGRMKKLQFLSASNNCIRTLPASFMQLRLETLDLFANEFLDDSNQQLTDISWNPPSLVECCARMIRKHKLPYDEEELHTHLCRYLDSARICWCGAFCFENSVKYTASMSLKTISPTVSAVDTNGRTDIPVLSFLCSPQCYNRFKQNPYAYWRK
ncbi:hypothetical protein FSP39_007993 [Pinctada imbricata]|uniref:PIF1/LRR1 pleckstrin homology domain-containing protein n=1 Tax=Pinctada imbricata TaxID=66713 RepID=A0AA89BRI7_PINIB|nr:hypothetical protein FSP39_007993 [Pinctada imbricata]